MNHLVEVRTMGCILCEVLGMDQQSPTEAHHPRSGVGKGQKAPDALAIPLCGARCHRGPSGVHGDQALLRVAKVTEMDLVAMVIERRLGVVANVPRVTARRIKKSDPAPYQRSAKILEHRGYSR